MSGSGVVRTARQVPWPAADTMKKPDVISMIDWRASPPKWLLALRARDWNAAASAARCSTSACSMPREAPRGRPSWERNTARVMCGTRSTRSSSSQSSWFTGYRWSASIGLPLRVPLGLDAGLLPAPLHGGQRVAHIGQRRRGDRGNGPRSRRSGRRRGHAQLRREAGLADAARQFLEVVRLVGGLAGGDRLAGVTAVAVCPVPGGTTRERAVLPGAPDRGEDVEGGYRRRGRRADRDIGHYRDLFRAVPPAPGPGFRRGRRGIGRARQAGIAAGGRRVPQRAGDTDRRPCWLLVRPVTAGIRREVTGDGRPGSREP